MRSRTFAYTASQQPERSLWLNEALDGERDLPALEGSLDVDVSIVGGGYTGLWTAMRIKELEPSLRVALVEADICGGGPSGRNGGLMNPWRTKFFAMESLVGEEEALRMIDLSVAALDQITEFCDTHDIDAQITRKGSLWVASTPGTIDSWVPTVKKLRLLGKGDNYRDLSRDEVAELSGTDMFLGGVIDLDMGKIQPALLARGMRRVALEAGVEIYENSPMIRLTRDRRPTVHTPHGQLTAGRLVLATGPWLGQVRELGNAIAVVGTDMIATERMPERLTHCGALDDLAISDSRMMVNYFRTTADGRLAWGFGGGTLDFGARIGENMHGTSPRSSHVAASLRHHYPQFGDVRITHSWTGPVDRSPLGVPFFSTLDATKSVIYGGGYSGNGLVPAYVGGRILAALALDLDDEYGTSGLIRPPQGRFPPEPIRYLGGHMVRMATARVEAEDQAGRKAGLISR
ncbi:MAG: FAD-dependent oxidoreductase, partial [Lacisediminihabitans sp.]